MFSSLPRELGSQAIQELLWRMLWGERELVISGPQSPIVFLSYTSGIAQLKSQWKKKKVKKKIKKVNGKKKSMDSLM